MRYQLLILLGRASVLVAGPQLWQTDCKILLLQGSAVSTLSFAHSEE